MTTQPTAPADPWAEFQGMTLDERSEVLGRLAGFDPALFVRVMDAARELRAREAVTS